MRTQSNAKRTVFLLGVFLVLISSCLFEGVKSYFYNQAGRHFPENFPIVGGHYPNDFLPWGVMSFFVFGLITVTFFFRRYDSKKAWFVISYTLILITSIMILLSNLLTYREGLIRRNEAGGLILVWIIAYWAGVIWAYSYHRFKTFFNKPAENL